MRMTHLAALAAAGVLALVSYEAWAARQIGSPNPVYVVPLGADGSDLTAGSGLPVAIGSVGASGIALDSSLQSILLSTGAPASAACGTDSGNCDLTALIKRVAQNLTTATIPQGQATMAASVPVAIASNQTPVPISGTVTYGTLGQAAMTASVPVAIANNQGAFPVTASLTAAATGGCTGGHFITTVSTNAQNPVAAATTLCSLSFFNPTTTVYWIKLYNKASAPTCNSDTVIQSFPIAPAASAGLIGGVVPPMGTFGQAFSAGFAFCVTALESDGDNTNAVANLMIDYSTK